MENLKLTKDIFVICKHLGYTLCTTEDKYNYLGIKRGTNEEKLFKLKNTPSTLIPLLIKDKFNLIHENQLDIVISWDRLIKLALHFKLDNIPTYKTVTINVIADLLMNEFGYTSDELSNR